MFHRRFIIDLLTKHLIQTNRRFVCIRCHAQDLSVWGEGAVKICIPERFYIPKKSVKSDQGPDILHFQRFPSGIFNFPLGNQRKC